MESSQFVENMIIKGAAVQDWSKQRIDRLFWEVVKQRRCVVTEPCPTTLQPKRVLRLVKIRIIADIFGVDHVLYSRLQIDNSGDSVHRKQLPLRRLAWKTSHRRSWAHDDPSFYAESTQNTEDPMQACKKALKDRLGLSFEWQKQHLEEDKSRRIFRVEDNITSTSYPGLVSLYAMHEVAFRVADPAHLGVQCLGLPSGQEFATTEGNFEVSYDGGKTTEHVGAQLNLWTWERVSAGATTKGPTANNPIKRVPLPALSGRVLCGIRSRATRASVELRPPSAALRVALESRETDWTRVKKMSERIADPNYSLNDFWSDLSAFPELDLYLLDGDVVPAALRNVHRSATSSGRTIGDEYQRTVGAFFAIYWLMRIPIDGKEGFCFGVDDDYVPIRPSDGEGGYTPPEKRLKFYRESLWDEFETLLLDSEVLVKGADGKRKVNAKRVMTLLALTAVHDIMKVPTLLPIVQPCHSPYHSYMTGDEIGDHDQALSYIMDYYPDLLPSFNGLDDGEKESVKFTQCEICFNHGWLVQAEAPPGAVLTRLKQSLKNTDSKARKRDVALYFVHWITDLAGAEPTPLGGCEKFVMKFPLPVLNSFLRSFKVVTQIASRTETEVMEEYLKMRWQEHIPSLGPPPKGKDALLKLRLLCMAQANFAPILQAVPNLPAADLDVLCTEMSRTSSESQSFSAALVPAEVRSSPQGPCFLVYYGPAYLQSLGSDDANFRLSVLAEVYRAARHIWPASRGEASRSVTVRIDAIKACSNDELQTAAKKGRTWVLVKKNNTEGMIESVTESELNSLPAQGVKALAFQSAAAAG